jgi:hypothetical protein
MRAAIKPAGDGSQLHSGVQRTLVASFNNASSAPVSSGNQCIAGDASGARDVDLDSAVRARDVLELQRHCNSTCPYDVRSVTDQEQCARCRRRSTIPDGPSSSNVSDGSDDGAATGHPPDLPACAGSPSGGCFRIMDRRRGEIGKSECDGSKQTDGCETATLTSLRVVSPRRCAVACPKRPCLLRQRAMATNLTMS